MTYTADQLAEMDVVYYVRPGEVNHELRLSLNSLANLPHRRVFIVGHTPHWVRGVTSIPGNLDRGVSHWRRGWDNVRIAAEYEGDMSDHVVMMNDDFMVLDPVETLPVYYRGTLEEHIEVIDLGTSWGTSLYKTWEYLDPATVPLSYEVHVPMPVDREALAEHLWLADGREDDPDPPLQWRTVYGNLAPESGGHEHLPLDVKVKEGNFRSVQDAKGFLSTSDRFFRRPRVSSELRRRIPGSGPYT